MYNNLITEGNTYDSVLFVTELVLCVCLSLESCFVLFNNNIIILCELISRDKFSNTLNTIK